MNTTINTANGPVEVSQELLAGYISESSMHYSAIEGAKTDLKLIGEALEEKTGIKASLIMKYIKAKHDDKVKDTKELGELFGQLDIAMGPVTPLPPPAAA
jgi:hypothetical protein